MVKSHLGQLIRDLRESSGLSQEELAENVCSQSEISKIESGRNIPNVDTLIQIAVKLGVDFNYFFNRIEKPDYDFLKERFTEIRKAIRNKDYKLLEKLLKKLENHPLSQNNREKQFLRWHLALVQYYLYQNKEKSLMYLNEALSLKKSLAYTEQEIEILNSIGIIYCEEKNCIKGIKLLEESLEAFNNLPYVTNEKIYIRILYNLAKSYYLENHFADSLRYCQKGIDYCLDHETSYLLGELFYQQGLTYMKMKESKEAVVSLNKAKALFEIQNKEGYVNKVNEKLNEMV